MSWLSLTLKNASRRRLRTGVTLLGVAIAIAALCSLLGFERGYERGMRGELDRLGAHVLVVPKGCPFDSASIALHGASWPCYLKTEYVQRVRAARGVETAAPLLMNALYDDTGGQTTYLGADASLLRIKRGWHIDGAFPAASGDCLVGALVARKRGLRAGDAFALPGLNGARGRVCGVLAATQGADDTFIYMPMADAQRAFKRPGQLTHILVRLNDPNAVESVVGELRGCDAGMDMNVVPLAHLFRTIQDLMNSTRLLLGCIAAVALLIAGAGVSNTILMSVTERTREIGVMRAVGASRGNVFFLTWAETVLVCTIGGGTGLIIAAGASSGVEQWLRERMPFAPSGGLVHFEPAVMLCCLAAAILLGTVAGLLPAWRASRLSPVQAMQSGRVGL
jgi:putative ABC transport system permease protein